MTPSTTLRPDAVAAWAADLPGDDPVTAALVAVGRARGVLADLLGGWSVATASWLLTDTPVGSTLTSTVSVLAPDGRALEEIEPIVTAASGAIELVSAWPLPNADDYGWCRSGRRSVLHAPAGAYPERPSDNQVPPVERVRDADGLARALAALGPLDRGTVDVRALADNVVRWFRTRDADVPAGMLVATTVDGSNVHLTSRCSETPAAGALVDKWRSDRPYRPAVAVADGPVAAAARAAGFADVGTVTVWRRDR